AFGGGNIYGLTAGSGFSTTTSAAILDTAFGNAAKSIPLIADEWDMMQFDWPSISCKDMPQVGYFLTAYIQRNLAGSTPNEFDNPPYQLTSDYSYKPRGYGDVSKCTGATNDVVGENVGDVGALAYAWYHGVDLWGGA